jgi:Lipase maturation factor
MPAVAPELVWGLALRAIALIYLVAFWSLHREILALCGSRGITPAVARLARMRRDMGTLTCVLRHPSLLWFWCGDRALRWLPRAGMACAVCAAAGLASRPMLAGAWVAYLSLDVGVGLTFPWESMLFEAGLLAILLPPLDRLPALRMSASPDPLLMWAFQWLLFRVMFGFGKNKFTKDALGDHLYLRSFLISQPMPSPLGWRAWRLPRPLLVWSHWMLFATEMILPFLVFFAGWPRLVAAVGISGLMISIQAMGNFGFFNVLVAVLTITLLDPRSISLASIRETAFSHHWPIAIAAAWLAIAGLCHLPFNTWVSRGWLEWPAWAALPRFLRGVLAVLRAAMPWRTAHAYGVFPPRIGPPIKWIPVVEATLDGTHWEPYVYRYMPSTPVSPPRFVAPHTPRLDHFALYDGVGVSHTNLLGTIFSQANPYDFAPTTPTDRLLQRLLEPDGPVHGLFARVPFNGRPPRRVRMRLFSLTPTTPADRARTGCYWHMDLVGEHAAERGSDPTIWERSVPAPEQFHPDERWARRRVRRLPALAHAASLDDVRAILDAEAAGVWPEFWEVIVPEVRAACDAGWTEVVGFARARASQHGAPKMDAFDRIRGAVTTALLERVEPRVLGRAGPPLVPRSYFHVSLWAHAALAGDPARLERALAGPAAVTVDEINAPGVDARGLLVLTVFRPALMTLHARKQRVIDLLQLANPATSPLLPGFHLVMPLLAASLRDPDERLPALAMTPTGDWTYNGTLIPARRLPG